MYNLQLKKLRKRAGYKSQAEMAKALDIPERRYASWERQEVGLNLEQACMVADVLECTLDELAGREPPADWTEERQRRMNEAYLAMTDVGRDSAAASVTAIWEAERARSEGEVPDGGVMEASA